MMLSCLVPGFESLLKTGCSEVTQCADKGYETKIPPSFQIYSLFKVFFLTFCVDSTSGKSLCTKLKLGDHPPGADLSHTDAKYLSM